MGSYHILILYVLNVYKFRKIPFMFRYIIYCMHSLYFTFRTTDLCHIKAIILTCGISNRDTT